MMMMTTTTMTVEGRRLKSTWPPAATLTSQRIKLLVKVPSPIPRSPLPPLCWLPVVTIMIQSGVLT